MRLVKGELWIEEVFDPPSAPELGEVYAWVESGMVAGRIINGEVWVDAERFALGDPVEVEELTGMDLLTGYA